MTEEMKKELAFTEEELKELEQFYQFPKPFYQLSKFLNFDTKISLQKLLPTKSLVNPNVNIPQTSLNPEFLPKVRKADEIYYGDYKSGGREYYKQQDKVDS